MPYKVEKRAGHKNSEGKPAPYCVVNKNTKRVVASSPSKTGAEKAMKARYANE
jgi:hypothetical protein